MSKLAARGFASKPTPSIPSKPEYEAEFRSIVLDLLPPNSGYILEYSYIRRKAKERGLGVYLTDVEMDTILDALKTEWFPSGQPPEFK